MMREFSEQELVRREKCENLRKIGLDPFGHKFLRNAFALEIKEKYVNVAHDDLMVWMILRQWLVE